MKESIAKPLQEYEVTEARIIHSYFVEVGIHQKGILYIFKVVTSIVHNARPRHEYVVHLVYNRLIEHQSREARCETKVKLGKHVHH